MINLFYLPASGSVSSSLLIYSDNSPISGAAFHTDVTLEISASGYETSGSTFTSTVGTLRTFIKSGSIIYASFPTEETNIYYVNSDEFSTLLPFIQPLTFFTSSFSLDFNFQPISTLTSSDNVFEILSGSTVIFSTSGGFNTGTTPLVVGTEYKAVLSGSGAFYTSSISIINTLDSTLLSYVTSSNSYLTASFSSSTYLNNINIIPRTETFPYIQLTYNNVANIPVSPTNSLDGWNTYLNISASIISSSGATIYVAGGYVGDINNLSIETQYLVNFTSSRLNNLSTLNLSSLIDTSSLVPTTGSLTSFPNLNEIPNITNLSLIYNGITGSIPSSYSSSLLLQEFNCTYNKISGSIQNILSILPTSSLEILNVSNNKLTGSIPNLSSSVFLTYFDCSLNQLSGSILPQTHYNLQTFISSNNNLTGSIPDLSNCTSLTYFDCSINKLTGLLPNLSSSYILTYFNVIDNNLTGSIPPITGSIQTFYCGGNQLSGSIGSLNGATNLVNFACNNNALTGSIPYLVNCNNLEYFSCTNNKLSNYSGSSTTTSSFDGPGLSPTLYEFFANNNQLKSSDINNILYDLDKSGAINGVVNLSGSTNAAPTAFSVPYIASLSDKGWNVITNPLPSQTISIVTGSSNSLIDTFNFDSGSTNIGQTFSMFENGLLQNISLQLQQIGAPSFDLQLNLYDQLNGLPNNLLATSSIVAASSVVSGSFTTFTFDDYYLTGSISSTGSYIFGLTYSNIINFDYSNQISVFSGTPGDYPYGYSVYKYPSITNWISGSSDIQSTITYLTY